MLSELGASAGLNLLFDRYAMVVDGRRYEPADAAPVLTPGTTGALPAPGAVRVAARAGCDLNPLDPAADRLRLLAYIWADQPDRLARTAAALYLAAALRPPVARAEAAAWLEARLAEPWPGHLHLVYHTIAAQYFPAATRARIAAALAAAGACATAEAPLAHLAMEGDGGIETAALTLTLWDGGPGSGVPVALARVDYHGRFLHWTPPPA